jgi:GTP cyclohydrolase I
VLVPDEKRIADAWRQLTKALGYDGTDPHLAESPERVARFMAEWHSVGTDPPKLTAFPSGGYDELIAIGDLRFHSLCAHHGLPFSGIAAVGYIPSDRIVGLSKIARVVRHFASRFQVQERLTRDIAGYIEEQLKPIAIGVVMRAEHLCMSMRGVRAGGHFTVTSDMRGAFREQPEARAELLALLRDDLRKG